MRHGAQVTWNRKFQGGVGILLQQPLNIFSLGLAGVFVSVAVEAAQFKGDEASASALTLAVAASASACRRFLVSIWVWSLEGKIFQGAAFAGGFLHVAEQVCGGKGDLPFAGAEAEVLDLLDGTRRRAENRRT